MTSLMALCISIALALVYIEGGNWYVRMLGILLCVIAGLSLVTWLAIDAIMAVKMRKPLLPVNEYAALKRKTVKKLRREWKAGTLTSPVLRRRRNEFLMAADELGIMRNISEDDFDLDIKWRVKH